MNYLELCQAVRSRIGLHGSGPTTVIAPTDVEKDIVDAVRDSWIDIQNYRPDWDWMRDTATFSVLTSKQTYTRTDVGGPSHRIRKYVPNSMWLNNGSQWKKLVQQEEDYYKAKFKNDTAGNEPYNYAVQRRDQSLLIEKSDASYSVEIDYYKTAQVMTQNTTIPEFETHWHTLIVYLAIQKLSSTIASPSTGYEFAQAYAVMMGQLMRSHLKKKSIRTRGIA